MKATTQRRCTMHNAKCEGEEFFCCLSLCSRLYGRSYHTQAPFFGRNSCFIFYLYVLFVVAVSYVTREFLQFYENTHFIIFIFFQWVREKVVVKMMIHLLLPLTTSCVESYIQYVVQYKYCTRWTYYVCVTQRHCIL
jgi:hypothetical protein